MNYSVTTFYKFTSLEADQLPELKQALEQEAADKHIIGLLLLASEGVNATLAGEAMELEQYQQFLTELFGELTFKNSVSDVRPFKRFKVKIKPEIVQLDRTDLQPTGQESHLSPEEWDAMLATEDVVLIDVRNTYETKLGTFKKAIDPETEEFSQFPEWVAQSDLPKDQKIGIFCTAGIRCEKAAVAMKEQGYTNVHQLDGGILTYLEKRPHQNFEGECFVFDHRTAVDQNLQRSQQYAMCTACGNGGTIDKTCQCCSKNYRICEDCLAKQEVPLCSKNCRYIYQQKQQRMLSQAA